jgi:hypothetical protein
MSIAEKYNRLITGIISAILLPVLVILMMWLFSSGHNSLLSYLNKIANADIITHIITLCVFPNVFIFLIFNRFDMLEASRGVLGITIVWAIIVFIVKFV